MPAMSSVNPQWRFTLLLSQHFSHFVIPHSANVSEQSQLSLNKLLNAFLLQINKYTCTVIKNFIHP